jgi:NADH dehydrogenase (ubiquinone) 1 alpha/beta subcomplex 1
MFRTALLKSARSAASKAFQRSSTIARPIGPGAFVTRTQFTPSTFQAARCYSAAAGLQKNEVEGRIVDLLKNFDKVLSVLTLHRALTKIFLKVSDPSKV